MARPIGVASWCLYDWANSAVNTVIGTFVFSIYFAGSVWGDDVAGSAVWGYAIGISGLAIAISSPVLGAIADHTGRRKPWIAAFLVLTVVPTALLWYVEPSRNDAFFALAMVFLLNWALELGVVFNNAMLPGVAPSGQMGRVSGWAFGLGYAGGLVCLAVALLGFVGLGEAAPWFDLPRDNAEHVRATSLLVAVWFTLFSIPLFRFTPDTPATGMGIGKAVATGMSSLKATILRLPRHRDVIRFLIASALYRDAIITITAVGGLYAAGAIGMGFDEIIIFAIGLNVTAGLGAAGFAWVDDWIGPKRTIIIALIGLLATGMPILMVDDATTFIALALCLGAFFGPAQAAGRTMMARLSPEGLETEFFGLYALSGKSVAFLGPLIFGFITDMTGSQRAGMGSILVFIVGGLILMTMVREPSRRPATEV